MRIAKGSAWQREAIDDFLTTSVLPIRLAVVDEAIPLLCSIWYDWHPEQGKLWCASHESSKLVKVLLENPRCAFEVSVNHAPYKGVRGQGTATLLREPAIDVLSRLIVRYLGDTESSLAKWLLSRGEGEFAICIEPTWLSAWDYGKRMGPATAAPR